MSGYYCNILCIVVLDRKGNFITLNILSSVRKLNLKCLL